MLYREIMAVCAQIHTKHIHCVGRTWNFLMLHLVIHEVNIDLEKVNKTYVSGVLHVLFKDAVSSY